MLTGRLFRVGLEPAEPLEPTQQDAAGEQACHSGRQHVVPVFWHVAQPLCLVRFPCLQQLSLTSAPVLTIAHNSDRGRMKAS